jgi:acyl-CoA thioesterase I
MTTAAIFPGFPAATMADADARELTVHSFSEQGDLEKITQMLKNRSPLKWVFAGDSITQGAKHTLGYRSYPEIFAERVRWEMGRVRDIVINTGVSGNTSKDIVNDYQWRIGQFNPAVVSVMIGTNDASVKKEINLQAFHQNNIQLVRMIRQGGAIPVIQTPNIIDTEKAAGRERLNDYVAVSRSVARSEQVILVDHFAYWAAQLTETGSDMVYGKWMNDELHPNGKGHLKIAQQMFKKLMILDSNTFTGKDI